MQVVAGKIRKLLHDSVGEVSGLLLDTGLEIRFPSDGANLVLETVRDGSDAEVHTWRGFADAADMNASLIINLDHRRSMNLSDSPAPQSPEVPTGIYVPPRRETPLALPSQNPCGLQPPTTGNDMVDEIEQAYHGLHRTQAMVAYSEMIKQEQILVGQYLDEARHTYTQALSRYQAGDFEGAREFAAASSALHCLVDVLMSRTFHSHSDYPERIKSSPERPSARSDKKAAQQNLDRAEWLLARVHWVTENGTLPFEDRTQVARLSLWSERLCRVAHRLLENGAMEDAVEFAEAAGAAVSSAEHLCRKCYVTRTAARERTQTAG